MKPIPYVIDNQTHKLADVLNELLSTSIPTDIIPQEELAAPASILNSAAIWM